MITRSSIAIAALASTFFAAIANAFVPPSRTIRHVDSRQKPLPRAFVGGTKAASTSNGKESSGDAKSSGFWDRLESVLFAPLESKIENDVGSGVEDPRLLLAEWKNTWEETVEIVEYDHDILKRNATAAAVAAEESLRNFLEVWAKITLPNDSGLTTPVSPTKFKINNIDHQEVINGAYDNSEIHYQTNSSMKLIFRPPKRYLSYKEQKSMEKNGVIPDRKGAKVDAWSPGGVEVEVAMTVTRDSSEAKSKEKSILGVTARRCNIDGDTVIKKTSERAIVRRLENAIRIWKKSNLDKNR